MVTSITPKRTLLLAISSCLVLLSSCGRFSSDRLALFPIRSVNFPPITEELQITRASNVDFELMPFNIVDSTRLLECSQIASPGFLFTIRDIATGEPVCSLCRYGRGPGEFQALLGWTDIHENKMPALDPTTMKYYEIDINKTQEKGVDVYSCAVQLSNDVSSDSYSISPIYKKGDELIAYVSPRSGMTPCFYVYDLISGEKIREYRLFSGMSRPKDRLKAKESNSFQCFQTIKPDRTKICIAMPREPEIIIMDTSTGKAFGIRIQHPLGGKLEGKGFYFRDIAASDTRIYALYTGNEEKKGKSYICVFNWEGKFESCILLDQVYYQLKYNEERLYLTADFVNDHKLYFTYLPSINPKRNGN